MKNKNILYISVLIIFVSISLINIFKNKARNWLIYTPKPIGTYDKNYADTLFSFENKNLFVNDQDGNTYCINQKTGKILWATKIKDYSPFSPKIIDSQNIAINGFDSNLYMLNTFNGIEKWRFTNPNNTYPDTTAITDNNDEDIFFGDRMGTLYSINKNNGQKTWTYQLKTLSLNKINSEDNPIHFGKIFQDENNIYVKSSSESKLIALDKKNGTKIWEYELKYEFDNIIITDNTIINTTQNILYVLDKNNGNLLWKTSFEILPKLDNIDNEYIYIASEQQKLKKINLITGKTSFTIDTSGKIKSDIIFIKDRGYLLHHIKGQQNNLIVFNKNNGNIFWEAKFDSDITSKTIFRNDFILLGSLNGQIFKIDTQQEIIINQLFIGNKIENIFPLGENIIVSSISEGEHAVFTKISRKFKTIWNYKTPYKIAINSINFNENRLFFTDKKRQLIGSINTKTNKKVKFSDFIFRTKFEKNKKQISKMIEYTDSLSVGFLKKIKNKNYYDSNNQNFVLTSFYSAKNYLKKLYLSRKDKFFVEQNYDNSIIEITLTHNQGNLGQPLDKEIKTSATLTSPSGRKYNILGFLYQKNTWKVRFRPNEIGNWNYQLKIKTPLLVKNITLKKSIEISNISNIKYVELNDSDPFNFYLEGGSKYYPLGLEDVMLDFNYDKNPLNQWISATTLKPPENKNDVEFINFDDYLNQYSSAGFNLYRWGVGNASFTLWNELSNYQQIDPMNNKYGDELVKELRNQDFHIMMTLFGFHPPSPFSIENKENKKIIENYLDHVIPRYSSYIDIWEITNEAEVSDEWLKFIIDYIKNIDPYHHPISTNWDSPQSENLDLQSIHWYSSEYIFDVAIITKNYINNLKKFNKPILFSEMGNQEVSWDELSAQRMRLKIWSGFFNQAYFVIWNQPGNIYYNTQNANLYLGPKERSYTKIFSEYIKNIEQDLEPFEVNNQNSQIEVFGLKNKDIAYIYVTKTENFENETNIKLPFKAKNIVWTNPQNGKSVENQALIKNEKITIPPFEIDIVAKINLW